MGHIQLKKGVSPERRRLLPQTQPRQLRPQDRIRMGVELSFPLDGDVSGAQLPANYAPYSIFHAFDNYLGICYYPLA